MIHSSNSEHGHAYHLARHLAAPFTRGAENIKNAVSKSSILNLPARVGRFALGILEMIPVINYFVSAIDKHASSYFIPKKICTIDSKREILNHREKTLKEHAKIVSVLLTPLNIKEGKKRQQQRVDNPTNLEKQKKLLDESGVQNELPDPSSEEWSTESFKPDEILVVDSEINKEIKKENLDEGKVTKKEFSAIYVIPEQTKEIVKKQAKPIFLQPTTLNKIEGQKRQTRVNIPPTLEITDVELKEVIPENLENVKHPPKNQSENGDEHLDEQLTEQSFDGQIIKEDLQTQEPEEEEPEDKAVSPEETIIPTNISDHKDVVGSELNIQEEAQTEEPQEEKLDDQENTFEASAIEKELKAAGQNAMETIAHDQTISELPMSEALATNKLPAKEVKSADAHPEELEIEKTLVTPSKDAEEADEIGQIEKVEEGEALDKVEEIKIHEIEETQEPVAPIKAKGGFKEIAWKVAKVAAVILLVSAAGIGLGLVFGFIRPTTEGQGLMDQKTCPPNKLQLKHPNSSYPTIQHFTIANERCYQPHQLDQINGEGAQLIDLEGNVLEGNFVKGVLNQWGRIIPHPLKTKAYCGIDLIEGDFNGNELKGTIYYSSGMSQEGTFVKIDNKWVLDGDECEIIDEYGVVSRGKYIDGIAIKITKTYPELIKTVRGMSYLEWDQTTDTMDAEQLEDERALWKLQERQQFIESVNEKLNDNEGAVLKLKRKNDKYVGTKTYSNGSIVIGTFNENDEIDGWGEWRLHKGAIPYDGIKYRRDKNPKGMSAKASLTNPFQEEALPGWSWTKEGWVFKGMFKNGEIVEGDEAEQFLGNDANNKAPDKLKLHRSNSDVKKEGDKEELKTKKIKKNKEIPSSRERREASSRIIRDAISTYSEDKTHEWAIKQWSNIKFDLINDKDNMLALVKKYGLWLKVGTRDLQNDYQTVLEAILQDPKAGEFMGESLKMNRQLANEAISKKNHGFVLQYFNEEIRNDRELQLKAAENSNKGIFLKFATDQELKRDKEFVKKLIEKNYAAADQMDSDLKKDKPYILELLNIDSGIFKFCYLKNDLDVAKRACYLDPSNINFVNDELLLDKKKILELLQANPLIVPASISNLKCYGGDMEILKIACKLHPNAVLIADPSLIEDPKSFMELMNENPEVFNVLRRNFLLRGFLAVHKDNSAIAKLAYKHDKTLIDFFSEKVKEKILKKKNKVPEKLQPLIDENVPTVSETIQQPLEREPTKELKLHGSNSDVKKEVDTDWRKEIVYDEDFLIKSSNEGKPLKSSETETREVTKENEQWYQEITHDESSLLKELEANNVEILKVYPEFTKNFVFMLKAIQTDYKAISFADETLINDQQFLDAAFNEDPRVVMLNLRMQHDKTIALFAMKKYSSLYPYFSKALQLDKDVLRVAGKEAKDYWPNQIIMNQPGLRKDRNAMIMAIKRDYTAFKLSDESLLRDPSYLNEAFETDYHVIMYNEKMQNDLEKGYTAVKKDVEMYKYLSAKLKENSDILRLKQEADKQNSWW